MKKLSIIFIVTLILMLPITSFTADSIYRLMHNDQQGLVIAEVVESDHNSIEFKVEKSIVSRKHLNEGSKIKQLKVEKFKLNKSDSTSVRFYENEDQKDMFKKGDIYLVSFNKKAKGYEVAWGIYKLSGLDYKTLNVVYPENSQSPEWTVMEAISVKEFINSDGKETEFSFDGEKNIVKSGDKVIYDGNSTSDPTEIEKVPKEDVNKVEKDTDLEKKDRKYDHLIYIVVVIVLLILLKKSRVGSR